MNDTWPLRTPPPNPSVACLMGTLTHSPPCCCRALGAAKKSLCSSPVAFLTDKRDVHLGRLWRNHHSPGVITVCLQKPDTFCVSLASRWLRSLVGSARCQAEHFLGSQAVANKHWNLSSITHSPDFWVSVTSFLSLHWLLFHCKFPKWSSQHRIHANGI